MAIGHDNSPFTNRKNNHVDYCYSQELQLDFCSCFVSIPNKINLLTVWKTEHGRTVLCMNLNIEQYPLGITYSIIHLLSFSPHWKYLFLSKTVRFPQTLITSNAALFTLKRIDMNFWFEFDSVWTKMYRLSPWRCEAVFFFYPLLFVIFVDHVRVPKPMVNIFDQIYFRSRKRLARNCKKLFK